MRILHTTTDGIARWGAALAAAAALVAFAPATALAQGLDTDPGGFGIDVNGGYYTLSGDDFDILGVEGGLGADATLRYSFPGGFGVGAGGEIAFLGLEDSDENADLTQLYGELRYDFPTGTALRPFVAGRVGYAQLSPDDGMVDGSDLDGIAAGGNAGVAYWLSDEVAIQGAALLNFLNVSADDDLVDDADFSGTELGAKAGVKVVFP